MPVELRDNPSSLVDITRYPYKVHCIERNCNYSVAAKSYEAGVAKYTSHTCPYIGGPTSIGWSVTLTTLEKCWIKLDAVMVELMEGNYPPMGQDASSPENPERVRLKGVCRGMAELLAEFMGPHFRTTDEIAGEAKRRYDAKKAGEPYETVGLGHLRLQGPPGENKYAPKPVTAPRAAPFTKAATFTDEECESIKFAAESGMFTNEQLAKTYKVKVEIIEAVLRG